MINDALPVRLKGNVSAQRVGDEILLYDELRHQAFCLNRTSSAIWRMCDGTRTAAGMAAAATLELEAPVSEDLVRFALQQLRQDGLLEPAVPAPDVVPAQALSRRTLMRTLGASAVVLLPTVAAVMAPKAAQAYNGCFDCSVAAPHDRREDRAIDRRYAQGRVQGAAAGQGGAGRAKPILFGSRRSRASTAKDKSRSLRDDDKRT